MMMSSECWQVEVFGGATQPDIETAPLMFGTPTVYVGGEDEGLSDPTVPLVYGPVAVRTVDRWAAIETYHPVESTEKTQASFRPNIHREMAHILTFEIDHWGHVRLYGLEQRDDGAMVSATWEVTQYQVPQEATD